MCLSLAVLLAGCGSGTGGNTTTNTTSNDNQTANKDPINIGVLAEQSGAFSWFGAENVDAVKLYANEINAKGGINGRQIKVFTYDNGSQPSQTISGYRQLVNQDHVSAIIGTGLLNDSMAIASTVATSGPVWYSMCGAYAPSGQYNYAGTVFVGDMEKLAVDWLKQNKGVTRLAVLSTNDDTGQQQASIMKKIAAAEGIQITDVEFFNGTDVNITPQLAKIAATKPQALVAWVVGKPLGVIFKGLQQASMDIPVITSYGNIVPGLLQSMAAFEPKQLYIPATPDVAFSTLSTSNPLYQNIETFRNDYKQAYGEDPGLGSGSAWDAMGILTQAISKVGSDPAKIADYLPTVQGYQGVVGVYNLSSDNHRGLSTDNVVMVHIVNGKLQAAN